MCQIENDYFAKVLKNESCIFATIRFSDVADLKQEKDFGLVVSKPAFNIPKSLIETLAHTQVSALLFRFFVESAESVSESAFHFSGKFFLHLFGFFALFGS